MRMTLQLIISAGYIGQVYQIMKLVCMMLDVAF